MQVSIETTTGLERILTVGVPAERVDGEVETRLKKAAKTVRLDGFRPGKVPMRVIKQRFGAGVRQEVLGEVISQSFYEAIQQEDLRPAGQPAIEQKSIEPGNDVEFVATFEVYPEVHVAGFDLVKVEKPVTEVNDEDVDKMVETLRQQHATWEQVEKTAEIADQVNIDDQGTKDGQELNGGSAEGSDLVLGSNSMIPGFEDALVGLKAGDEKIVPLTFPEAYHAEDLKGADVEFNIKINQVKQKRLPELNEEFFQKFAVNAEGGESAFRVEILSNMQRELKQGIKNNVKQQVMDGLLENNSFDVPKAVVAGEIDALRNQAFERFGGAGANIDSSVLPDELFREQAERRVKLGLVLAEIVKKEEIKPDADKVRKAIEELASTYEDPEQVINWYYSNEQQLASFESMVLEEQVVERILTDAEVTDKSSTYDEVMNPSPPEPEETPEEEKNEDNN